VTAAECTAPYDLPAWRSAPDGQLRPGGLALTDRAIALCGLPRGARVWDIGCGLGVTVERLIVEHGLDAAGVDWSPDLLRAGGERSPGLPLRCATGADLPCPTGALDGVLLECSWSAMARHADGATPDPIVAECRRVLRPGGRLAITDLYARAAAPPGPAPLGDACWSEMPTEPEIRAELTRHGFTVEVWEDHSVALREFAARLILEWGSLTPLLGAGAAAPDARAALAAARPGYFLLVARRD
jgi:SAM-dependent methyltransferase